MTTPTALATPDELAAYLGGPPPNAAQATFALAAATGLVRSYCGWSITRVEDVTTWTVSGTGDYLLLVPTLSLRSVSSIVVDGTPIDTAGVSYSSSGVLRRRAHRWPSSTRLVVVEGQHGYDETPAELVAVVCSIASRAITLAGKGPVSSYRVGGVQVTYAQDSPGESIGLTDTERRVLDLYRLPGVA